MNNEYNAFDPANKSSPVGVFLRVSAEMKVYCDMPCFQGTPDCRISGSIVNSKQMLTRKEPKKIALTFGKATAWYVNSTLIHTRLGKCSFAWDGGTQGKVNNGCGCIQGRSGAQEDCDEKDCPFNNKVPPDFTQTSNATSSNVEPCICTMNKAKRPEVWDESPKCFWRGVAFYPPGGDVPDETHDMLQWRMQHQSKPNYDDPKHDPLSFWNEMVLDGHRLLEELKKDAAATIPAIVYDPTVFPNAKADARRLADDMQKQYGLQKPVPIIKVDTNVDVTSGQARPFIFEKADKELLF